MSRTFLRQDAQIRQSVLFDDTLASGATLQSSSVSIEGDLNSTRSQLRRILDATPAGNWYDDVATVNAKKRGLLQLNTDLDDLEIKPFLFRCQSLVDVTVTAAQNWEVLVQASGETPTEPAAVDGGFAEGAVVATLPADVGSHSLLEVAGANALSPKNLCIVIDATTGDPIITTSGENVLALLQCETGVVDGEAFNDTTKQVQLSFVMHNATQDDLIAVPVGDIAGKTINFAYVCRKEFDNLPETAFLGETFVDNAAIVDVTLDNAIDNQSGPATQVQNIEWRISDTFQLRFQESTGARNLLLLAPTAGGDTAQFNVDTFDVNNALDADFLNGSTFDSGGTPIRVGVTAGYIDTASADLGVRAGLELYLDDANQTGSTWAQTAGIKLSDTTAEWDAFEAAFGEVSLLKAITDANGTTARSKTVAVLTANVNPDVDVGGTGGGANLDAQLGDYSTKVFLTDVDIFLNGALLRNGANAAADNDVYPGTSAALGQLKFEFKLHGTPGNADVITMILW